jgi:hypothetical protein
MQRATAPPTIPKTKSTPMIPLSHALDWVCTASALRFSAQPVRRDSDRSLQRNERSGEPEGD